MPWTRRHLTALPLCLVRAKLEMDRPSLDHNIVMLEPIAVPLLAVNVHALYIVVVLCKAICRDPHSGISVDRDVDVFEPGTLNEVDWLCDNRIETEHLPDEPAV